MEKDKLVEIIDLKVEFKTDEGRIVPVDGISFHLNDGETTAVVGESGCGKSLTALSIMGLIDKPGRIAGGQILFKGKDLVRLKKHERDTMRGKDLSMIFQEPMTSLNPVFTVGNQIAESIMLHQHVSKKKAKQRGIEFLKLTGISRAEKIFNSYPHALSGGMRQRVMIAMALSCNPKLLIADEPTTALDVSIQAQILELMKSLSREFKTAIMLITHDLGVVAEMADQVVIMYAGQVVEKSDVFSLFSQPLHPYTQGLLGSMPKLNEDVEELDAIEGVVPNPNNLPQGCRFYPRCKKALPMCKSESPQLCSIALGHEVRCWQYQTRSGGEHDEN